MNDLYPYIRRQSKGQYPRIEVGSDSMRVGKTTAIKVIEEGLRQAGYPVFASYEDWQNNPFLTHSYDNPTQAFLASQKWFIKRKWEQVVAGAGEAIFLQDVNPEMDYCYAVTSMRLGRMSKDQFQEYHEYFHSLEWDRAPAPDLLIYLEVSDDVLIARAEKSRREFEKVESHYFLTMKQVNRAWADNAPADYTILRINTDSFDFAHDLSAREVLIHKVIDRLGY